MLNKRSENKLITDNRTLTNLIMVFNRFKREPHKLFILRDISQNPTVARNYIFTLLCFGLIEEKGIIYKCGRKHSALKKGRGYRLKGVRK